MTKLAYPVSLNCWLRDYPRLIKITFGPSMDDLDGPWTDGSVIYLERIGFDNPDTSPVAGEVPLDVKVAYSDNGTDTNWIFKISMFGWGTFFSKSANPNYFVSLEKWIEFESTYFDLVKFRLQTVVETQIPKATTIPNIPVPVEVIYDPPPGEPPPVPVIPPNVEDAWDSTARTLVTYYKTLLNLDTIQTVSATVSQTAGTGTIGRQIGPVSSCAGQTCEFWIFGNQIFIVLYSLSYNCEDFLVGEPMDCEYSAEVSSVYTFNSIIVNGYNRLQDLVNRV